MRVTGDMLKPKNVRAFILSSSELRLSSGKWPRISLNTHLQLHRIVKAEITRQVKFAALNRIQQQTFNDVELEEGF